LIGTHVVVREIGQYKRRYHSRDDSSNAAETLEHA
jgi:hypothetical protein